MSHPRHLHIQVDIDELSILEVCYKGEGPQIAID